MSAFPLDMAAQSEAHKALDIGLLNGLLLSSSEYQPSHNSVMCYLKCISSRHTPCVAEVQLKPWHRFSRFFVWLLFTKEKFMQCDAEFNENSQAISSRIACGWPVALLVLLLLFFSPAPVVEPNSFAQRTMAVVRLAGTNRLFLSKSECHTLCTITTFWWLKYITSETNIEWRAHISILKEAK